MDAVVFFYPHSRSFRKTYEAASGILQREGYTCHIARESSELTATVNKVAPSHNSVLLLGHSTPVFRYIGDCLWRNVFYYGGQTICKSLQSQILRSHGLSVPDWIKYPESKQEVFDKLGPRVVAKVDECSATARRGVAYVTPDDFPIRFMHRLVFTKYEGELNPPYWKARVVALFGEILFAHMIHKNVKLVGGEDSTEYFNPDPHDRVWNYYTCLCDRELLEMGQKASMVMSDVCGCGVVAVDMVGHEGGKFIVEANPTEVCLAHDVEPWDTRFNRAEAIAKACIKKIREFK